MLAQPHTKAYDNVSDCVKFATSSILKMPCTILPTNEKYHETRKLQQLQLYLGLLGPKGHVLSD